MYTLFFNGRFYSHTAGFSEPEALLVRDGLIIARGSRAELEEQAAVSISGASSVHSSQVPVGTRNARASLVCIDVRGQYVLPGFNDAHIHVWKVGNLQTFLLDVRGVSSLDELGQRLATAAAKLPDTTTWILARGFNEAIWDRPELPTSRDLDQYVWGQPVHLMRTCAHIVVLNSAAVAACGLTASTPVPVGGEIRQDQGGVLSGIITESALGLVAAHIPAYTPEQYEAMILAAEELLFSKGITSATDPAVHPELLQVYHKLNQEGRLRLRVNAIPILLPDGGLEPVSLPPLFDSARLKVQTAKLFADGGLSSQTAAIKRPYLSSKDAPLNFGVLRIPASTLQKLVFLAREQGYSMAIHAIGDLAIEQVLTVYEQADWQFKNTRPNRIEHLELPHTRDLDRMEKLGIIAVMQPIFLRELGLNFRQTLDSSYLELLLPVKTLLRRGIVTAFSTDAPVVADLNPFQNIATAMTRADLSGQIFSPHEAVTAREAISAYTLGAAQGEYSSALKGSIVPGMYADLIFLDENPLAVIPEKLTKIHVTATYLGGVCVYES